MLSSYSYVASRVKSKSLKATLDSDTPLGSVEATGYVNKLDSAALPLHYFNTITVASVQDLVKAEGGHTFRFAVEYRDNKVNTTSTAGAEVGYRVYAPSAMWTWQATSNLLFTAAARYDSLHLHRSGPFPAGVPYTTNALWDRTINATSYNLGAVITVTDKDTVRLIAARGVQAPTLVELGSRQVLPATAAPKGLANLGNPNLNPAIITNYEAAYERAVPAIGGRVSAKLFTQHTDDVKSGSSKLQVDIPATATTWGVYTYLNLGQSDMSGFELAASGKTGGGFHWSADATRVDITDKPPAGYNPVVRLIAYSKTTPKWRGNLAAGWSGKRWSVDSYVHEVSDFASYANGALEPVPGYTSLGGRVARRIGTGLEVALDGQNLLQPRQMQAKAATGLEVQRRVLLQLAKTW